MQTVKKPPNTQKGSCCSPNYSCKDRINRLWAWSGPANLGHAGWSWTITPISPDHWPLLTGAYGNCSLWTSGVPQVCHYCARSMVFNRGSTNRPPNSICHFVFILHMHADTWGRRPVSMWSSSTPRTKSLLTRLSSLDIKSLFFAACLSLTQHSFSLPCKPHITNWGLNVGPRFVHNEDHWIHSM